MERFNRIFERVVVCVIIFCFGIACGYAWCMYHNNLSIHTLAG